MSGAVDHLARAWERRRDYVEKLRAEGTNAFRLFGGRREAIADLTVDCLGDVASFHWYVGKGSLDEGELGKLAEWALAHVGVKGVYLKRFVADRSKETAGSEQYSAEPFAGEAVPAEVVIHEYGVAYLVKPYAGFSTGLFLDQRENRRFLASEAKGKRVLNCFAYTCGFSVAAARAGAQTVSVDLSAKYLEWGKRNFALNSIPTEGHFFFASDVFEYFRRAEKKNEQFDLIILDPPSFSRDKKAGVFSIEKDFKRLVAEAYRRLGKGGRLFVSSNFANWNSTELRALVDKSLAQSFRYLSLPPTPADFALDANPLSQAYLSTK